MLKILVWLSLAWSADPSFAEPWLSSRFAEHCSSCHAPGRLNLPPAKRRCTLSCQGCHVNPNGGGLRSYYGKWNGNRMLKSFRSDILSHDKSFADYLKQPYGGKHKFDPAKKDFNRKKARVGFQLKEIDETYPDQEAYEDNKMEDGPYKTTAKSRNQYLYNIPKGDPWRQMALSKVDGGGDIRWQITNYKAGGDAEDKDTKWKSFLMAVDFGLRYRPFYRKLHFVYESRMMGGPAQAKNKESVLAKSGTRSLYAMVDDLPYNVFAMGGYYRPLFGNYVPDHTALGQQMVAYGQTGRTASYGILYNAVSVGTAPNVPYLNVHKVNKQIGDIGDRTDGFATNIGLRGVTNGWSINHSYWKTTNTASDNTIHTEMHSFNLLARFRPVTVTYEAISVIRDDLANDFRQGGVHTLDTYTRVWREFYLTGQVALANVTPTLQKGSSSQLKFGFRAFLWPGVDLALSFDRTAVEDEKVDRKTEASGLSSQLHLYF